MPSDNVLLIEDDIDLLTVLSKSQIHRCLTIPFEHLQQILYHNKTQTKIEEINIKNKIKQNKQMKLDKIKQNQEEKDEEEQDEERYDLLDSDGNIDLDDDYNDLVLSGTYNNSQHSNYDNEIIPNYKVFESDEEDEDTDNVKEELQHSAADQIILKHQIIIPMPMKSDFVEIQWNLLHINVFGFIDKKCVETQTNKLRIP